MISYLSSEVAEAVTRTRRDDLRNLRFPSETDAGSPCLTFMTYYTTLNKTW